MAKVQVRPKSSETDTAAAKLLNAHNQIMEAWFEHWRAQERSRIDLAFRSAIAEQPRKEVA